MCFTCWLRSGFPHFMNIDSLSFTWSLLAVDTRLVLTTFKITNLFNLKDAVPEGLRTRVVYKFSCARRIVMLVMLVKPADVSPHEFAGTYFPTGLRMVLDICRVQSLVEHPADRTASRSWTLQLLSTK